METDKEIFDILVNFTIREYWVKKTYFNTTLEKDLGITGDMEVSF